MLLFIDQNETFSELCQIFQCDLRNMWGDHIEIKHLVIRPSNNHF